MRALSIATWLEVAVLLVSLGLLAFVSASATALTGVRRTQVRRLLAGDGEARRNFEARYGSYRSSLVAVRILGVVGAITTATLLAADLSGIRWWAMTIAAIGSAALIVLAEAPARARAARDPDALLRRFATLLALLNALLKPVTRVIPLSSEAAFSHSFAGPLQEIGALAEAKVLKQLLAAPAESKDFQEDERRMIRAILALNQTTVKEIMVPRPDFVAVSSEATLEEAVRVLGESRHSRMPVFEGTMDNVIGVLYAKDVLNLMNAPQRPSEVRKAVRPAYFVPETKRVRDLLQEFQDKGVHFALVVDEYGGVEGLVSLNDVMAEIVGEIEGEHEASEDGVRLVGEREALVDGALPLGEVSEAMGVRLKADGFETIGGYVLHHLGRIPRAGETLEADGLSIRVEATAGRRITRLRVRKLGGQETSQAARGETVAPSREG